jgi:ribose/xylose/arabinose/galactoside ABC-type transport system permease subunit
MVMIMGLFVYFSFLMPDIWLTTYNLMNLVEQTVSLGLVALGLTVVRAAGEMDLSVGSMVSLASMLSMGLIMAGRPIWLAIVIALFAGLSVGFVNGFMRTTMRIPGVIPTIGSQGAVAGIALIYNWGNMIFGRGPAVDAFCNIGRGYIGPISIPAAIFLVVAFVIWFLLNRTKYGRLLYMIGGNPEASRLSGVKVNRHIRLSYIMCGILAASSGIMMTARIGAGNPLGGNDLLLDGIIAVMVGSTVLAGEQEFNPVGSIVGAFFVTLVMTGLQMIGKGYHVQCILRGVLLLVALTLFSLQRRASE